MKSKLLTKQDKLLLKRILAYIKPYKLKYILLVTITLGGITVGLVQPLFTRKLAASLLYKDFNRLLNCVVIISILSIIQKA
jgi:hypothetical protein